MKTKMSFVVLIGVIVCTQTILASGTRGFQTEQKTPSEALREPSVLGFAQELGSLRKMIIAMCAQLQAGKPLQSKEQLLAEIDRIIDGWKTMAVTYKDNPPREYAQDPAWKGYFINALDNFEIMRGKAESGNYDRAKEFCGMNCGLFVTMNQINGIEKISDRMFLLRKNVKMAMDMVNAGNMDGALATVKQTDALMEKIIAAARPTGMDPEAAAAELKRLDEAYRAFSVTMKGNKKEDTAVSFKMFFKTFGEVYLRFI